MILHVHVYDFNTDFVRFYYCFISWKCHDKIRSNHAFVQRLACFQYFKLI